MKKSIVLILLLASFVTCKKGNDGKDVEAPVVMITAPLNLQTFSAGQNIPIVATITDNDTLSSVHLNIEGPDFIHYAYTGSGQSQNISEDIPISISGKYNITIEGIDKAGNHGHAKVDITVN